MPQLWNLGSWPGLSRDTNFWAVGGGGGGCNLIPVAWQMCQEGFFPLPTALQGIPSILFSISETTTKSDRGALTLKKKAAYLFPA